MSNYQSTNSKKDWRNPLLRKTWMAIIVVLILGVLPLIYKTWPGCLVSIIMLVSAISLGILTYHIINIREGDQPGFKQDLESNLKNILNLVLICTAFFFIGGLICLFTEDCKWWVWAIIVWLGVSGGPFIVTIMLDPESFNGKEET